MPNVDLSLQYLKKVDVAVGEEVCTPLPGERTIEVDPEGNEFMVSSCVNSVRYQNYITLTCAQTGGIRTYRNHTNLQII